jgi:L-lactate dehydrogenase complex protein LldF
MTSRVWSDEESWVLDKIDYVRQQHHDFLNASQEAMADPRLQSILGRLADSLGAKNQQAWQSLTDSEQIRLKARSIKDQTLAELDRHLATLEQSVLNLGGHMHWADDGAQACQVILDIIRAHDAVRVVKSKSMTSEEIHLNQALERAGIETVETDFGEYIIQQAGHRPSHIVGPALHLSANDVARILSEASGEALGNDRVELASFARRQLRQKFAEAEIGITGVNFAIAQTGSIVLISNEGNARLTTSMPRVHIALMGMEKVIPRLDDLPYFLKVLARAATGQKMSIYTSVITGPRRDAELDGPDEFHLVVLDNGRSRILSSPLRESLFCIRCGACLNACPIYRNVGGHAYGGVYTGPIGAVLTPLYDGLQANKHLPQASSLCGACQAACPVKIAIPELLIRLRARLQSDERGGGRLESLAYGLWAQTLRRPRLYRWATWLATRTLGRWKRQSPWITRLPGKLHGWTERRDFPAPAARRFRDWWNQQGR